MDWRDSLTRMALKLGPALLIITSFVTIMLGILFHAISINELEFKSPPATHFDPNVIIGDKYDGNLVWFLQVTDLHLSNRAKFKSREDDFKEFAKKYVDIFKPDVVLVTGDITDGRIPNSSLGTGPQLDEWLAYNNAVQQSGVLSKNETMWLDIRGNHDNFNVYRPKDPKTLFRQYSIQGKSYERNYVKNLKKGDKIYTFIGVDEVQTPGIKIPFNFIGVVKQEDIKELRAIREVSKTTDKSEYRVWFAHYPTSSVASPGENLRNIIDGPYLCGHFHTIGNYVTQMHASQQPGFVELELGDWKYNRRIRLASIDHQLFNFIDFDFKQFPIALITNPKRSEYSMPKFEPAERIINSTHIRVIAFSNSSISKVLASIDGMPDREMKASGGPLYTLEWNPKIYSKGEHRLKIRVEDAAGLTGTFTQKFSLDGTQDDYGFRARVLLRASFRSYVMTTFYFIVTVCTLPLIALIFLDHTPSETRFKHHYKNTFIYKLHLLCKIKRISLPLLIIPLFVAIGPHFIGYLVDEAIGACFVWGILIDGAYIYTGITYTVGSIFLLFVHVPEVLLLTYQANSSYASHLKGEIPRILNIRLIIHLGISSLQIFMGSLVYSAYGTMAFFTSIPFFWCMFLYGHCWYQCKTICKRDFKEDSNEDTSEEQQALTEQRGADKNSNSSSSSSC